jgi:hypothetical protein
LAESGFLERRFSSLEQVPVKPDFAGNWDYFRIAGDSPGTTKVAWRAFDSCSGRRRVIRPDVRARIQSLPSHGMTVYWSELNGKA